jgi:surface antigen
MRLLALALALYAGCACAQFVGLLKNSPAELYDDEDLKLFLDAARKSLDEGGESQRFAWQNPKTGHRGEFTVLKAFQSNGRDCKRIGVHNEAKGRKSDMRHNLCKVDGRWRLVGDMKQGDKK